jgi:hypothetical protein
MGPIEMMVVPPGKPTQIVSTLLRSANVAVCHTASALYGLIYAEAQIGVFDHFPFGAFMNYVEISVRGDRMATPCYITYNCSTAWSRSPCGSLLFRHVVKNDESYRGSTILGLLSVEHHIIRLLAEKSGALPYELSVRLLS